MNQDIKLGILKDLAMLHVDLAQFYTKFENINDFTKYRKIVTRINLIMDSVGEIK